jgi:hypothetical protein
VGRNRENYYYVILKILDLRELKRLILIPECWSGMGVGEE